METARNLEDLEIQPKPSLAEVLEKEKALVQRLIPLIRTQFDVGKTILVKNDELDKRAEEKGYYESELHGAITLNVKRTGDINQLAEFEITFLPRHPKKLKLTEGFEKFLAEKWNAQQRGKKIVDLESRLVNASMMGTKSVSLQLGFRGDEGNPPAARIESSQIVIRFKGRTVIGIPLEMKDLPEEEEKMQTTIHDRLAKALLAIIKQEEAMVTAAMFTMVQARSSVEKLIADLGKMSPLDHLK